MPHPAEDRRPPPGARSRVEPVDLLRGFVIVLMTLDHVRDFVHAGAMAGSPTDLGSTNPTLFLTRWITHLCAPAFALTAGLGAWLWLRKGRTRRELSRFLLVRGLLLVALELTVMQFAYGFSVSPENPIFLLVLWSLGLSMVLLAGLAWLPLPLLGALALGGLLLHPMLGAAPGGESPFMAILLGVGVFKAGLWSVIAPYSIVPWAAVMALGFCLGPLYERDAPVRRRVLLLLGVVALALFGLLRTLNVYGDPTPWSAQATPTYSILSFLNVTKYPASPAFLLMTLGSAMIFLASAEGAWAKRARGLRAVRTLGRVSLFYYVTHFYVAHLMATVLAFATYGPAAAKFVLRPYPSFGGAAEAFPPGFGYSLAVTYLVWLAVIAICVPLARRFGALKAGGRPPWLRYL